MKGDAPPWCIPPHCFYHCIIVWGIYAQRLEREMHRLWDDETIKKEKLEQQQSKHPTPFWQRVIAPVFTGVPSVPKKLEIFCF